MATHRAGNRALLLLLTLAVWQPAWGQVGGDNQPAGPGAPALRPLRVPTATGVQTFFVSNPGAPRSFAWRQNVSQIAPRGATAEPGAAYELTNRVIVRTLQPDRLRH